MHVVVGTILSFRPFLADLGVGLVLSLDGKLEVGYRLECGEGAAPD